MRKIFCRLFSVITFLIPNLIYAQNVGIGTNTPHSSAQLDISSSSGGLLPPRITGQQRNSIVNPAAGLIIYCSNCGPKGEMQYFDGTGWVSMKLGPAANPDLPIDTTSGIIRDSASNLTYSGSWRDSSNGGSGFRPWRLFSGTGAGFFIGNPANDGMATGGIDTVAFGMFATGTQYANAQRTLSTPMKVGDEFSFYWAMNWDANTGNKGFDLFANDSVKVLNINNAGTSAIVLDTAVSQKDTLFRNYGTRPMLVKLFRKDLSSYTLSITSRDEAEPSYTGTINSSLAINVINLYIGDQRDNNPNRNIYFNKFRIDNNATPPDIIFNPATNQ